MNAGAARFRRFAQLDSWAWATGTRSALLMWVVGPQRYARRIARSVGIWEATDEIVALDHATELMNACVNRWPHRPDRVSADRIVIEVSISGWAADLTGARGDVRVVVSDDGQVTASRIKRVSRPDVSRHFDDRRFEQCGVTFDVDVQKIGELANVSVFAMFEDGSATRLGPTENVSETLAGYGIESWNTAPFPAERVAVDEPAGHVDDLRVQLAYRGSWIERRRLGMAAMVFTGPVDSSSAVFATAIRCGHDFLGGEFLSIGERQGTLTPFQRATMLVALGRDAEAAQLLRVEPGSGSRVISFVAPVEHLDRANFSEVLAASAVEVSLPEVWEGRSRGTGATRLEIPALGVHHVGPATLVRGSTVLVDGRLELYEDAADPSRGFVAGTWDHVLGFEHRPGISIVRAEYHQEVELDEGVLLSGRCDFNHFHFLIEYLPRLGLVDRVPSLDGVPLIVTDELNPSSRDALAALSGNHPVITVSRGDMVKVRSLHVPSMHTFVFDSTRIPWIQGSRYSPTLMLEMRDRLIDAFPPCREFGPNIFLARSSSSRGLENGDELIEVALSHGFESVDPGELSFAQQVDLFSNATLLLGVGGAAYANVIFAPPGARVLSMVAEQLHDFSMHSTMADLVDARMTLLLGRTEQRASDFRYRRDYLHASFSVDPKLVDEALTSALR